METGSAPIKVGGSEWALYLMHSTPSTSSGPLAVACVGSLLAGRREHWTQAISLRQKPSVSIRRKTQRQSIQAMAVRVLSWPAVLHVMDVSKMKKARCFYPMPSQTHPAVTWELLHHLIMKQTNDIILRRTGQMTITQTQICILTHRGRSLHLRKCITTRPGLPQSQTATITTLLGIQAAMRGFPRQPNSRSSLLSLCQTLISRQISDPTLTGDDKAMVHDFLSNDCIVLYITVRFRRCVSVRKYPSCLIWIVLSVFFTFIMIWNDILDLHLYI